MDWTSFFSGLAGSAVATLVVGSVIGYVVTKYATHEAEQEERGEKPPRSPRPGHAGGSRQ